MKYPIFDAHCDTIFEMAEQEQPLRKNGLQLDLARRSAPEGAIQVFAAFVDKTDIRCFPMQHVVRLIQRYHQEISANADLAVHCTDMQQIHAAVSAGKTAALLSIEGGEALGGDLAALWMFYQLGVRLLTLTWNHANELADGITEPRGGGLTAFGRQVVQRMNELGMVIDVSHLSERAFWDVAELSDKPFVASHSCVKKLCAHPRNLTDAQIQAIVDAGGCIGVNFYTGFLTEGERCTSDDIVRHLTYLCEHGAAKHVGLGSDFDGVESLPEDIRGAEDLPILFEKLQQAGFTEEMQKDIASANFLRVFSQII